MLLTASRGDRFGKTRRDETVPVEKVRITVDKVGMNSMVENACEFCGGSRD
jgi:hypothetical protein